MTGKRAFDIAVSLVGLVLLAPLLALLALAVRLDSPGPALFRQERVGRHGRTFRIAKFRTMRPGAGPLVTAGGDPRVTRLGARLRHWKLDELPQLWNVLRGDMSLVGPRPEVPRYVAHYPADLRGRVLSVRPGITDPAAVRFRHEEALLAAAPDPERCYLEEILPAKLALYADYVAHRSFAADLGVLAATVRVLLGGAGADGRHGSGTSPAGASSPGAR